MPTTSRRPSTWFVEAVRRAIRRSIGMVLAHVCRGPERAIGDMTAAILRFLGVALVSAAITVSAVWEPNASAPRMDDLVTLEALGARIHGAFWQLPRARHSDRRRSLARLTRNAVPSM